MDLKFTADEVYTMAQRIEVNGAKYYRKAAERTNVATIRELFRSLANMEDDHLQTFSEMRNEIPEREKTSNVYDPNDESGGYLRTMANMHVFNISDDPSRRLTGDESLETILKHAIQMEKDSIVFYLGMKTAVSSPKGKDRIDDIIEEEFGHIATLSDELRSLIE